MPYAKGSSITPRIPGIHDRGLEAFRTRYVLSYLEISDMCGGTSNKLSHSTVYRLCQGHENFRYIPLLKSSLIRGVRSYLTAQGKDYAEVQKEIRTYFSEPDLASYDEENIAVIAQRSILPAEVQQHFHLKRDPFYGDPRTVEDCYTNKDIDTIAGRILDAINYQGFIAVAGEIGSGKTTLKRRTVDTVERSNGRMKLIWGEFLDMKRVSPASIVSFILNAFGQSVPQDLLARRAKLIQVLGDASNEGTRVALGFDECHRLDDNMLTTLKNFWELGTGGYDRYLGVVLFGQPQFEGKLREHRFREIFERLEIVRVPPLGKSAWEYIAHRIKVAGGDVEKLFDRKAVDALAKQVSTPLALGNLANAALIKAHRLGEDKVILDMVDNNNSEPQVRGVRRVS